MRIRGWARSLSHKTVLLYLYKDEMVVNQELIVFSQSQISRRTKRIVFFISQFKSKPMGLSILTSHELSSLNMFKAPSSLNNNVMSLMMILQYSKRLSFRRPPFWRRTKWLQRWDYIFYKNSKRVVEEINLKLSGKD